MASDRPMTSVEISNFAAHLPDDDLTEDQLNRILAGVRDACNLAHTAGREEALAMFRMRSLVKQPDLTDTDEVRRLRGDLEKVRDWVNRRGVYAGDEDSEWWDGYRQAERGVMLSAHELIDSLEAFDE